MTMTLFNVRQFFGTLYQHYMFSLPAINFSRTQKVRINCRLFEVIVNTLIVALLRYIMIKKIRDCVVIIYNNNRAKILSSQLRIYFMQKYRFVINCICSL